MLKNKTSYCTGYSNKITSSVFLLVFQQQLGFLIPILTVFFFFSGMHH